MKRAGLVSSSSALQARESKQIKRNETIKKRWIAVFPSTHGLLRKKREREKKDVILREEEENNKFPSLVFCPLKQKSQMIQELCH